MILPDFESLCRTNDCVYPKNRCFLNQGALFSPNLPLLHKYLPDDEDRGNAEVLMSHRLLLDGRHPQEYKDLREQMAYISEEDMFVNGFRIGVGLLLDAVGTYESQFVRYHED